MNQYIMKNCLSCLTIIVFICWGTTTTGQRYAKSVYRLGDSKTYKACPNYNHHQYCRSEHDESNLLNYEGTGNRDNAGLYGQEDLDISEETGHNVKNAVGTGSFLRSVYGNELISGYNKEFGRPHLKRVIVASDIVHDPRAHEPSTIYVHSASGEPSGLGGILGTKENLGLNTGFSLSKFLSCLFGLNANLNRKYNNKNKIGGFDEIGNQPPGAAQVLLQDQDFDEKHNFEGLRQRYDFGLG